PLFHDIKNHHFLHRHCPLTNIYIYGRRRANNGTRPTAASLHIQTAASQQMHKANCGKPAHPHGGEPTTAQGQLRQACMPRRRRANNGTRPTAANQHANTYYYCIMTGLEWTNTNIITWHSHMITHIHIVICCIIIDLGGNNTFIYY
ncbi:MAG: hypothetical protein ACKPKO_04845, partial [Candidatus Fonsibacter sp.]